MCMDVVADVRIMVVTIPAGCVATSGEIGRALEVGPGFQCGDGVLHITGVGMGGSEELL